VQNAIYAAADSLPNAIRPLLWSCFRNSRCGALSTLVDILVTKNDYGSYV